MLAELIKHSKQLGLSAETGFTSKEVHFIMRVHSSGKLIGVQSLIDEKKGKTFDKCPDLSASNMISMPSKLGLPQAAHFLIETCGVAFCLPDFDREGQQKTDAKSVKSHEKNQEKHLAFIEIIRRAAHEIPEFEPIVQLLENEDALENARAKLREHGAKHTHKISFEISDRELLLPASDIWHDWWRGFIAEMFGIGARAAQADGAELSEEDLAKRMLDLIDAELIEPVPTHPKLTKLGVGAMSTGASLIGFDKDAFRSYSLEQGQNSAISETNATAYRATLDALLLEAPILGQMKVVVWFDHEQEVGQQLLKGITDPAQLTSEPEADQESDGDEPTQPAQPVQSVLSVMDKQTVLSAKDRAQQLLTALRKGEEPNKLMVCYHALAISGASGRVMVRDWKTGQLEQFAEAVVSWWQDLAICNLAGDTANKPKFSALLMSVQRPKLASTSLDDYLKPVRNLMLPLWRAALDPNMPIPFMALSKVMDAHRAHVMNGDFDKALSSVSGSTDSASDGVARARVYARMALLRAYHVRKHRIAQRKAQCETQGKTQQSSSQSQPPNQHDQHSQSGKQLNEGEHMTNMTSNSSATSAPVGISLDVDHPAPAYHCGRLMYLLSNLQEQALGDVNAGVVARYYGAASSTPHLTFGRLLRLSQHHLDKLASKNLKLSDHLSKEIADVCVRVGGRFPQSLNLEQQSLFALGYYQQLAHSVNMRRINAAKKKAEGTVQDETTS